MKFDTVWIVPTFAQGYVRPEFADKSDPSMLIITAGRHPVTTFILTYFSACFIHNGQNAIYSCISPVFVIHEVSELHVNA